MANYDILTAEEILLAGLQIMYTAKRIYGVKGDPLGSTTNAQRFKDHYGASHVVIEIIWTDLQMTNVPEGLTPPRNHSIHSFLESLHFLYRYKREAEREGTFDKSRKTLRKQCWHYLQRIQSLKTAKIACPQFHAEDVWIMTVDGTHCKINEPSHPAFSQDKDYFSHKHKNSGLCYELGIDLFRSNLIWMNGPFKAGQNDNGIFSKAGGLKEVLKSIGKKALGDKGHTGHPDECSTFNAFDDPQVKSLKSRAQMRHEQFNGMLKEFSSLDNCFRHGEAKFKICFEAICVICQCRMENGEPLFELLAGINYGDNVVEESSSEEEEEE